MTHNPGGKVKTRLSDNIRGLAKFEGPDNCYRLWLTRTWGPEIEPDNPPPSICFVGMNPSTADAEHNDPTIERLYRLAKRGYNDQ